MDSFYTLAIILYLLFVMYAANQADIDGTPGKGIARALMSGLIALMILVAPITLLSMGATTLAGSGGIDAGNGILVAILAIISSIIGYQALYNTDFQTTLSSRISGYRAESLVHQTALLLCLLMILATIFNFVIVGGLSGIAQSLDYADGISPFSVVFEASIFVIVSLLGVGFAIRRTWAETSERLGLNLPNRDQTTTGVMAGVGMFIAYLVFSSLWLTLSPQTVEEQTVAAQAVSNAITSLPLALLIAASAAISEEIFMRGALQPVFGAWLVSGFFAILHSQYLFTPIMVFIFALGMGFSWLRRRYGTSTAIIAHFVYNALPFVLIILAGGAV